MRQPPPLQQQGHPRVPQQQHRQRDKELVASRVEQFDQPGQLGHLGTGGLTRRVQASLQSLQQRGRERLTLKAVQQTGQQGQVAGHRLDRG
jgi:hypothetical protein